MFTSEKLIDFQVTAAASNCSSLLQSFPDQRLQQPFVWAHIPARCAARSFGSSICLISDITSVPINQLENKHN